MSLADDQDSTPTPGSSASHSPITYLIIGGTLGSLASIIFVAYINKQKALSKLKRKATGLKNTGGMPTSGSPLNHLLDDEKSA
jgi:hypothetical protein